MLERGLVQIYTGPGKGKTTAGFGLALRAAGHGNKVLIYQFLKPALADIGPLGERAAVQLLDLITVKALDEPWDMRCSPDDKEATARMRTAIGRVCGELHSGTFRTSWQTFRFFEKPFPEFFQEFCRGEPVIFCSPCCRPP